MEQQILAVPGKKASDFWIFWTGQTVSQIGSAITSFALPLLIFNLTGSALQVGLTVAANYLPYALFGLISGAWVDRVDRKVLMISLDIARALILALVPLLTHSTNLFIWLIYLITFLNATLTMIFGTASNVAIANLVRSNELVKANGRILTGSYAGYIVGPLLATLILTHWSVQVVLWCDALTFLVSAGSLALIKTRFNGTPVAEQRKTPLGPAILEGLRYVFSQPIIYLLGLLTLLANFALAPISTQLVVFAKQVFDASNAQAGTFATALGVGGMIAALASGPLKRRLPYSVLLLGSILLAGCFIIILVFMRNYWAGLVVWGCIFGMIALFNVAFFSILQAMVPDRLRGRVIQYAQILAVLVVPLSSILSGIAIDKTHNITLIFGVLGVLIVLIVLSFLLTPLAHIERLLPENLFSDNTLPPAPEELIFTNTQQDALETQE